MKIYGVKGEKVGIGEGLDALFSLNEEKGAADNSNSRSQSQYVRVATNAIIACPYQPRKVFSSKMIDELAASIREHGIIQPVILREKANDATHYELIAGERRWRAAKQIGLVDVPAIIQKIDDQTVAAFSLIV